MSTKGEIVWDISQPMRILPNMVPKMNKALSAIDERVAKQGESHMKQTATWQDQTGNARGSLSGTATYGDGVHTVTYSHGVPYGIWLEVRWGGKYAVIKPTVEMFGRKYMEFVEGLLNRLA